MRAQLEFHSMNKLSSLAAVALLLTLSAGLLLRGSDRPQDKRAIEPQLEAVGNPGAEAELRAPQPLNELDPDSGQRAAPATPDWGDLEAWRHNAAVTALAQHFGLSPLAVAKELNAVWPEGLELEFAPLAPWSHTPQSLAARFLLNRETGNCCQVEANELHPLHEVLGGTVSMRIAERCAALGKPIPRDLELDRLRAECLRSAEPALALRREYMRLLEAAMVTQFARGHYDRFPYFSLPSQRVHTAGPMQGYVTSAAIEGGWIVQFYLDPIQFPEFNAANLAWLEAEEQLGSKLTATIDQLLGS